MVMMPLEIYKSFVYPHWHSIGVELKDSEYLKRKVLNITKNEGKNKSWQALIEYSTHDFRSAHTEQLQGIMEN
ncbi:hypothetical protein TSUD_75990 [Trifolium subterraneum]|nr:hypothetical protein TSUD_75990 [Trifolium subterraneum]